MFHGKMKKYCLDSRYAGLDINLIYTWYEKSIGMAKVSMIAQVVAGLPVASVAMPATIPPIMPPTSNKVDRLAASVLETCVPGNNRSISFPEHSLDN